MNAEHLLNLEHARPTAQKILNHIATFEYSCTGQDRLTPEQFREINEELSISAVLLLGMRRYQKTSEGKRIFWKISSEDEEHDLGFVRDAKVVRDYPGYNCRSSRALAKNIVKSTAIIPSPTGKGTLTEVTLIDGSTAIAPNYRMAVRNAALKMFIQSQYSRFRLDNIFGRRPE